MNKLYLFTGAGNNFVVLDGRGADVSAFRKAEQIRALCTEHGTDGLMILDTPVIPGPTGDLTPDFSMEFYNPDGSGGMMCGNGGRCIVAFADMLGLRPSCHSERSEESYLFCAPDGLHSATILSRKPVWTVRLKMVDVQEIRPMKGGYFLNTGTRHFVKFVEDVNAIDIGKEGPALRWDAEFAPEGTNVNFVQVAPDGLHVRTFEKGVEGETLACGTGITASAIAAFRHGIPGDIGASISYRLQCRRGDWLTVEFNPAPDDRFTDVYLTGPAECVEIINTDSI